MLTSLLSGFILLIKFLSTASPHTTQAVRQLLAVIIFFLLFRFKDLIRFIFLEIFNYRTTSTRAGGAYLEGHPGRVKARGSSTFSSTIELVRG